MAHEILSVKLCELEDQFSRLNSRIYLSEMADHPRLQREIRELDRECEETDLTLRKKLQRSRAGIVSVLSDSYGEIGEIMERTKAALRDRTTGESSDMAAEDKILLAEYALDFAMQAANQALLLSMKAIDAQLIQQQKGDHDERS